jgi:uncharacterized circularly permuted ATP-grasp superfamily protein/uncharacterized alpha-E superfamily protein
MGPASGAEMFATYPVARGRFDELLEASTRPRSHWHGLHAELTATSPAQIRDRLGAAERQIREIGITYNVYADPQGQDRPWELDVLPMVIAPDEWTRIEQGITQRARLLDALLGNLYGSQSLLRDGSLPPALVFGHSGFLRPAHGIAAPGGVHLHAYAADLARSADGRWWVLADRTQAPSGAGYALENRLIVQRIFPELFRSMQVPHLARFFAAQRDALMGFAPRGDGPTLTVLLTPGPYNETYFEHALLARYLGFPLVEGGDLVVREGKVWLKTIGGLKRVHAILRRQDDSFCDPLELRADSALGVAGLLSCVRRGTVLIANALGSGVLESGSLLGFLPGLSEKLLGEPLRMPSIATWWCGQSAALDEAIANMDRLVFKPADPADRFEPIFGQDLDRTGREALRARIMAQPERFVAQELVRVSQAPVFTHAGAIGARGIGLRVFAVATPTGYAVMPGGLTRVAGTADARVVSMQRGGGSKDTWIAANGDTDTAFTLLQHTVGARELIRSGAGITSRVAENLYWFGRYAERCDDTARLLRVALNPALHDSEGDDNAAAPLHELAHRFGLLAESVTSPMAVDRALLDAATTSDNPFGLAANLRHLERVAFNLRDRMSADNWRTINQLTRDPLFGKRLALSDTLTGLNRIVTSLMTLAGFALDGMTRDHGWRLLSLGRRIERLMFQCLALDAALDDASGAGLGWLLELADSAVTYRSRYLSRPEWLPVLDLLVCDGANPRSLALQARGIDDFLRRLEDSFGDCGHVAFAPAVAALEALDPFSDLQPESSALRATVRQLSSASYAINDRIAQRFFTHAPSHHWASNGNGPSGALPAIADPARMPDRVAP